MSLHHKDMVRSAQMSQVAGTIRAIYQSTSPMITVRPYVSCSPSICWHRIAYVCSIHQNSHKTLQGLSKKNPDGLRRISRLHCPHPTAGAWCERVMQLKNVALSSVSGSWRVCGVRMDVCYVASDDRVIASRLHVLVYIED